MPRLEVVQLTTPEYITSMAEALGGMVAGCYYPVLFEYAFSGYRYPVAIAQTNRNDRYAEGLPAVIPGIETPGLPVLNLLIEKKRMGSPLGVTHSDILRQVSFYKPEGGGNVVVEEANLLASGERPETMTTKYSMRRELHSRLAAGEHVTEISPITVPTLWMIQRLIAKNAGKTGVRLTPQELARREHDYFGE